MLVTGLKLCKGPEAYKNAKSIAVVLDRVCSPELMTSDHSDQHLKLLAQMQQPHICLVCFAPF